MSKWIIDLESLPAEQVEEMERHYDRWRSITSTLEHIQAASNDHDKIKVRIADHSIINGLEQQQQEAYEAYTNLAGGLVHKVYP